MSVVVKAVEKVADTVVKTVEAVIKDPLPTLLTIAGQSVGIPAYVTQAAITAARGGDLEDVAKSVAISVATPAVAAKLAPTVSTAVSSVVTNEAAAQALTAATSQSLVAGSLTAATGGDWEQAAAGAFAGSMAASGYDKYVAPEVAAQAKSMGLSAETHANIQGALKSGLASGTSAAATGGDFTTGFANAVVESGWENLTAKASEGLQDVKKTFLKDDGIQDNQPTFAGIPKDMVDEVPMSLEGQLAQILSTPKSPEYGKQFGPELAGLSGGIIPYGKSTATDVDVDVPEVDFTPYVVDKERSLPPVTVVGKKEYADTEIPSAVESEYSDLLKKAAISGDTSFLTKATEFGKIPTYTQDEPSFNSTSQSGYLSSKDINRLVSKANQSSIEADQAEITASISPTPENIAAAEQAKLTAELDKKVLQSASQTDVPIKIDEDSFVTPTIEETNKNILNAILPGGQTAVTDAGLKYEPSVDVDSGILSPKDINRILSSADESAAAAVEAKLAASVNPTPENIAAAEQAQLVAELDQKAVDGLAKTDVPVGVEGEVVSAPTIDQTNESILKAILGGGETTGAPTPVVGQTGQDLLTVEGLQEAGLSDAYGFGDAGGISDPIDSQQGPLGTMTGNVQLPQTMQKPMSGAPMPRPGAPMPQGGLQFSTFNRVGTPMYFDGAPSTLSALGPLSELDMQSIMMMSPEEYAARTKSANIFRVARGGLIALNKKR